MVSFEFNLHFLHGTIVLLSTIILLPLILSTVLSTTLAKNLQRNLLYLLSLDILWNTFTFIEQLPPAYVSDSFRYVLYTIGAFCWVQYGYAILRAVAGLAGESLSKFWTRALSFFRIWNLIGVFFVLVTALHGKFYSGIVEIWYGYTAINSVAVNFAILAFLIFPAACAAAIALSSHRILGHRIYRTIFGVLTVAIVGGLAMDALFPAIGIFIYGESACIFMFFVSLIFFQAHVAITKVNTDSGSTLKAILEELDEGFLILNSEGEIEMANNTFCKMFGLGRNALLKRPVTQFIPEIQPLRTMNDIPHYLPAYSTLASISVLALYSQDILFGYRVTVRTSQKLEELQKRFAQIQTQFNSERDLLRIKTIALQQNYQQQQIFLNSLIDNLPARLWSKNLNGAYTQQNKKDLAVRGRRQSQIDSPAFTELETEAMASNGQIKIRNEQSMDSTGKPHWERQTVIPLYDENRHITGILGLIEDTTEFHSVEEERNLLRENLLKSATFEDMSNVAGGLAHDFNNILAAIVGYCELAQHTLPATDNCERPRKYLENMHRSMDNAAALVRRTLDLISTKKEESQPSLERLNVGLVFDEIKTALSATLPPNIEIVKDSSDDLIGAGNLSDFHRIMMNMGKNAILAMSESGGKLTYSCTPKKLTEQIVTPFATIPPGDYLLVKVQDTGTGMSPDVVKRIFTPFFTTRGPGEGTGIGLSTAMRLAKSAGAYISVETILGKGTTFNLYWPRAQKSENPENA